MPLPSFSFLLLLLSSAAATGQSTTADPFPLGPSRTTHLHFFFHDISSGPNTSVINIVKSPTSFGQVYVMDDPLTEGLRPSSKMVGRAQGIYVFVTQSRAGEEFALLMNTNLVFFGGEFNGSSLSIQGRNDIMSVERELPVVGGSGRFRMARGYALLRTRMVNATARNAVVECNVYVQHSL